MKCIITEKQLIKLNTMMKQGKGLTTPSMQNVEEDSLQHLIFIERNTLSKSVFTCRW